MIPKCNKNDLMTQIRKAEFNNCNTMSTFHKFTLNGVQAVTTYKDLHESTARILKDADRLIKAKANMGSAAVKQVNTALERIFVIATQIECDGQLVRDFSKELYTNSSSKIGIPGLVLRSMLKAGFSIGKVHKVMSHDK